jgi:hypothetical protein
MASIINKSEIQKGSNKIRQLFSIVKENTKGKKLKVYIL